MDEALLFIDAAWTLLSWCLFHVLQNTEHYLMISDIGEGSVDLVWFWTLGSRFW